MRSFQFVYIFHRRLFFRNQLALVPAMAWYRRPTSHCLNWYWPMTASSQCLNQCLSTSKPLYGVTELQWANDSSLWWGKYVMFLSFNSQQFLPQIPTKDQQHKDVLCRCVGQTCQPPVTHKFLMLTNNYSQYVVIVEVKTEKAIFCRVYFPIN